MQLAAIQFSSYALGGSKQARSQLQSLLWRAAEGGAELIVAPELAASRYVFASREAATECAETLDGPTREMSREVAARHGCWVSCGFVERDGDALFNASMLVGPGDELVVYRKVLLFDLDCGWATAGERRMVVQTPIGTICPLICMDLNDVDATAYVREQKPDVIAFHTAWLDEGIDVLPYWRYRLKGWDGWLVAANTWGTDGGIRFRGHSAILSMRSGPVVVAPNEGDAVLWFDTLGGAGRRWVEAKGWT